jgi:ATP-dependent protease ClpP protease subunit
VEDVVLRWRASEPWHSPTTSVTWFVTVCVDIFNQFAEILSFTPTAVAEFMGEVLMSHGDKDRRAASFEANDIHESRGSLTGEAAPFKDNAPRVLSEREDIHVLDRTAKSTAGTTAIITDIRQRINRGMSSLPEALTWGRFKTLLSEYTISWV